VKLHCTFRNVELAGNLFVRKIFEQRIENFLLATAQIRDGISLQTTALAGEDGINESGQKLPWDPESSGSNERQSTDQLVPGFNVSEKAFHTKTQERKAVGIVVLLTNDDEASFGIAFEKIGQQRTGSGFRGVRVNDVDLRPGQLQSSKVGREGGFKLLGEYLEWRLRQNAFELAQHQRVRREDANGKF